MKKKHIKRLRELADKMPKTYTRGETTERVIGAEILAKNPDAKDKAGQPLNPRMVYTVTRPVTVTLNHYKALKKEARKNGFKGVQKYVGSVGELIGKRPKPVKK